MTTIEITQDLYYTIMDATEEFGYDSGHDHHIICDNHSISKLFFDDEGIYRYFLTRR